MSYITAQLLKQCFDEKFKLETEKIMVQLVHVAVGLGSISTYPSVMSIDRRICGAPNPAGIVYDFGDRK